MSSASTALTITKLTWLELSEVDVLPRFDLTILFKGGPYGAGQLTGWSRHTHGVIHTLHTDPPHHVLSKRNGCIHRHSLLQPVSPLTKLHWSLWGTYVVPLLKSLVDRQMAWTDKNTLTIFFCPWKSLITTAIEEVGPWVVSVLVVAIEEVHCSQLRSPTHWVPCL